MCRKRKSDMEVGKRTLCGGRSQPTNEGLESLIAIGAFWDKASQSRIKSRDFEFKMIFSTTIAKRESLLAQYLRVMSQKSLSNTRHLKTYSCEAVSILLAIEKCAILCQSRLRRCDYG